MKQADYQCHNQNATYRWHLSKSCKNRNGSSLINDWIGINSVDAVSTNILKKLSRPKCWKPGWVGYELRCKLKAGRYGQISAAQPWRPDSSNACGDNIWGSARRRDGLKTWPSRNCVYWHISWRSNLWLLPNCLCLGIAQASLALHSPCVNLARLCVEPIILPLNFGSFLSRGKNRKISVWLSAKV